jgi:hypothetical protein
MFAIMLSLSREAVASWLLCRELSKCLDYMPHLGRPEENLPVTLAQRCEIDAKRG